MWTTCKTCNRVIWEKDADSEGKCSECGTPQAPPPPPQENA